MPTIACAISIRASIPIRRADVHRHAAWRDLRRQPDAPRVLRTAAGAAARAPWRRRQCRPRLLRPGQRLPLGTAIFRPRARRRAAANDPNPDRPQPHGVAGLLRGDGHPAEGRPASSPSRMRSKPSTKASAIIVNETFAKTFWPNGEFRDRQTGPQRREGALADRGRRRRRRQTLRSRTADAPGRVHPASGAPVGDDGRAAGPRAIRRDRAPPRARRCARSIPSCRSTTCERWMSGWR